MAIFVDENTKVVYQGLTGSNGRFYGLRNREYGTQVVAGTNPKKAGTDVEGIPVYANVAEAVAETGADTSCIFIPAPGRRGRRARGRRGRREADRGHHRGCPRPGRGPVLQRAEAGPPRASSCWARTVPGIISPGKCNIGITAGEIAMGGGPVGIVSRSGTLTYQALHELTQKGIGRPPASASVATPSPGPRSSTASSASRPTPRPRPS